MGKKSSNKKENKLSGSNIIAKIIVIVLAIVLLLTLSFYTIMDRIVGIISEFFSELLGLAVNIGKEYIEVLFKIPYEGALDIYKMDDDTVAALKEQLENSGIDTEDCGLTTVRLRKMLMAQAVSTSFTQTLCIATVSEDDILENMKQKEKYKNITDVNEFLNNPLYKKNSDDVWKCEEKFGYNLFYDSETFFYFKDNDNKFGSGADQWYVGAMGVISITTENGSDMVLGDSVGFEKQKEEFERTKGTWTQSDDEFAEEELLNVFTRVSQNEIKVYNINREEKLYDYTFENTNNHIEPIIKNGYDEEFQYTATEEIINIAEKLDTSSFAISIELMVDYLDMTGSGEFLETFIDFALNKTKVYAKIHRTSEINIKYEKEKYKIKDNFVIEVYDFIPFLTGNFFDDGDDNFRAYAEIVFKRKYKGNEVESVAALVKNENIDKDGEYKEDVTLDADAVENKLDELDSEIGGFIGTIFGKLVELVDGTQIRFNYHN